jgi:opacity protein-like surface antigen
MQMKSIAKILAVLIVLVFVPTSSYALLDFGVYGGYALGDIDLGTSSEDMHGSEYGFVGHFNGGVPLLITVGLGLYWQKASHTIDTSGSDLDADKVSYGFDAYAQLALPILIHPYVRGGIAIKEELDVEGTKVDDKFSSYHYGIGVALTVFPMIQLFAEYMRYESTIEDDPYKIDMSGNAFHVGAKISI